MNEEERQALLGLVGTTYGEQKKVDQHIVGESRNLARNSDQLKQVFQQVMVHGHAPSPAPPPWAPPAFDQSTFVVPTPQPVPQPIFSVPSPVLSTPIGSESLLVDISSKLDTIISILKDKKHGSKSKKTTTRKVSKLDIEDQRPVHPKD